MAVPTKLLALDLDGTTLTSGRVPHPANIEAVARARAAGITVVLASGRIAPSMTPFAEILGVDQAMICCNGAHLLGPNGQEMLAETMSFEILEQAVAYAVPRRVHVNAYTRDELLFLTHSPWAEEYTQRVKTLMPRYTTVEEARGLELLKVSLVDSPKAIRRHVRDFVPQINPELARPTESEAEYLEFMHPSVSKGAALARLASILGVDQAHTSAIGDYLNDVEMVTWAGIGAAVANAAEPLRLAADVQAPSNDDGAVAWFIDWLIQNGRQ